MYATCHGPKTSKDSFLVEFLSCGSFLHVADPSEICRSISVWSPPTLFGTHLPLQEDCTGGRKMPGRSLFFGGPFAMAPATPLGPSHDPAIMRLNQDVNEPVFCAPRSFEEEVSNGRFGTQVGSGSISLPCQPYWKRWKWKSHLWKACSSIKVDSCRQPHRLVWAHRVLQPWKLRKPRQTTWDYTSHVARETSGSKNERCMFLFRKVRPR